MIEVQNLTAMYVDAPFARRIVQGTLQNLRMYGMAGLSVVFVGGALMRRLNKTYHHENRVTDVLSFPSNPAFAVPELDGSEYLGEIVVCVPVLKKEAVDTRTPYRLLLAHVLIHGTLHLLGYHHELRAKDAEMMHKKEEEIMNRLCGK